MSYHPNILAFTCLLLLGSCNLIQNESAERSEISELTISANTNVYEKGLPSVWFSPSNGNIHPWGPDSHSVNPDSSLFFFKISPGSSEFISTRLQNKLYYGITYIGKGQAAFDEDYQGDSLEFNYNLFGIQTVQKDQVYYIRVPDGACQIMITGWNPDAKSLSFKWRPLAPGKREEKEFTLEIPELLDSTSYYWLRIFDGDIVHAPQQEIKQPEGYHFYIDPQIPLFKLVLSEAVYGGIGFLGIGEAYYNQSYSFDYLANLNYLSNIPIKQFKRGAVFILSFNGNYSQFRILAWDKSRQILKLRFKKLS